MKDQKKESAVAFLKAAVAYYASLGVRSERDVETLAKQWDVSRVLVEDAGAGTSLVQELRGRVPGIIAVKPTGDKESRMAAASAKFEAGQVFLPERAHWLPDLEAELFAFPGSRHDDQSTRSVKSSSTRMCRSRCGSRAK